MSKIKLFDEEWKRILPFVERVTNSNLERLISLWQVKAEAQSEHYDDVEIYIDNLSIFQKMLIKEILGLFGKNEVSLYHSMKESDLKEQLVNDLESRMSDYWNKRSLTEEWWNMRREKGTKKEIWW